MVRVHRRGRLSAAPTAAARHTRSLQEKTKAPYKVVFEQVTEKKKKLITVVCFELYLGCGPIVQC